MSNKNCLLFSVKQIKKKTGLSKAQIEYRLECMDMQPKAWKKGKRLFTESQVDAIKNYCGRKQTDDLNNPMEKQLEPQYE